MPCYSPLKGWRDSETGGIRFRPENGSERMEVACGSCLGCRLDRSRMWAMRILHESQLHEFDQGNCFVTLTYRDPWECDKEQRAGGWYMPDDWSLHKSHFQKFMKRLRKHFPQTIRFFHCGEYGDRCKHGLSVSKGECEVCNLGRPHYHAILFNCSFGDLETYEVSNGVERKTSPTLEKLWKYGLVDVGEVTFDSAAYVARYVLKKLNGPKAEGHYESLTYDGEVVQVEPEYCTMSRRPGIGREWFSKYHSDVFPRDEVPVPGVGVVKAVPRYYSEIFEKVEPMTMDEIKEVRKKFKEDNAEEYSPGRLMAKYKCAKARLKLKDPVI